MKHIIVILVTVIMLRAAADSGILFEHNPYAPLYWKALIQMTKNQKETALKIVQALNTGAPFVLEQKESQSIEDLFDQLFLLYAARDPQLLSFLGLFEALGVYEHNAHLTNVSPEVAMQMATEREALLQKMEACAVDSLTPHQHISYKILHWMLKHAVDGHQFLFHDYRINQMFSILSDLTMLLIHYHQLQTERDVLHYLHRLERIPRQLEQTIALLEHQKKSDILLPQFAMARVLTMIDHSLPKDILEHTLYAHLANRIKTIDCADRDAYLKQARQILEQQVYPAYQILRDYCTVMHGQTQSNHGVWALPDGDAYYEYMLQRHTTTMMTADQIHALGLTEVAKIQAQMRSILKTEGLDDPSKTIGQLMQAVSENPEFYFPQNEQGRKECLAHYHAILERARKELYPLFDIKPQYPVHIERVPANEEEGKPGAYYSMPSMDGSRPGIFFANLRNMQEVPIYGMETLTIHEAEPGHHFQLAVQQEMDMPIMRKLGEFTAYIEGWALYAEKLAYEHNFYSSSFSKLGHLRDELLRAARLVVDTGIHKKRWTREQAIEYMHANTGFHYDSIVTEVERYFVLPGQACAYKIGQLKILELRKRAKDALGDRFDIRQFHNVVLQLGATPLTVLEEVVDAYIAKNHA